MFSGLALITRGIVPPQQRVTEGPNILVVTLCSTRADRVGTTYARNLTPNLNRIASEGVSFSSAYTNATSTLPAHASLLTGLLPDRHGVIDFETRLSTSLPSLPGVLGLYGYRSAWVMESDVPSSSQSNAGVAPPAGLGLSQGFLEPFDAQLYLGGDGQGLDLLEAWLGANEQPFFALALLRSAHLPYGDGKPYLETLDARVQEWLRPPVVQRPTGSAGQSPAGDKEIKRMKVFLDLLSAEPGVERSLNAAYDSGVADVDRALGRVVQALEAAGKRHNTIIVVMGDHGEALGDFDHLGHDNNLDDAVVQVPLVWFDPDMSSGGLQVGSDVSTVDLMPTLLTRVGATVPVGLDGRDISKALKEGEELSPRPVRTQAAALPGMLQRRAVTVRSPPTTPMTPTADSEAGMDEVVSSGNLRVLFSTGDGLRADRREQGELVEITTDSAAIDALISWKKDADANRRPGQAERVKLSDEVIKQLRAEGYW
jgi:arylsulfatase A-like enzyme